MLVDSRARAAEHLVRQPDGAWIFRSYHGGAMALAFDWGTLELDALFDEARVGPRDLGA